MSGRNTTPVRAPHAVRAVLAEGAAARKISLSEYMASLVGHSKDPQVEERLSKIEQSFVTMRTEDVDIVRELSRQFDRRQWEVLLELHRLSND